ncbi:MAG: NAD-dependent protein deacylase [Bacteroidetes bacterium HGW-Bacteroidetes-4]|jgi:NAD-dependent deacetylase|nr:MAG: NAD-dependent protein deacylase [Bacteroidetes bacterium HGW-Bacteroidetes-4]
MSKKRLVVLSGAGMSAESGISTFRDSGGLWEQYRIEEVATPEAFIENPKRVLDFYNHRRKQLDEVEPNRGHQIIAELEQRFKVQVITQNVDNLHERAGSTQVLHLHGELTKVRSSKHPELIYDIGTKPIHLGDLCEKGAQLRPHIVWFGESVPAIDQAVPLVSKADIFLVIGTSLNVYPAAGLIRFAQTKCSKYLIDPHPVEVPFGMNFTVISKSAGEGMEQLFERLKKDYCI